MKKRIKKCSAPPSKIEASSGTVNPKPAIDGGLVSTSQMLDYLDSIKEMILDKNARYGDSMLNPVRMFSKASPAEQILVRLDDKLSRISRGCGLLDDSDGDQVIDDVIGYLAGLKVALRRIRKDR